MPLTAKEKKEQRRLHGKWARRTATMAEMDRCRELDRKERAEPEPLGCSAPSEPALPSRIDALNQELRKVPSVAQAMDAAAADSGDAPPPHPYVPRDTPPDDYTCQACGRTQGAAVHQAAHEPTLEQRRAAASALIDRWAKECADAGMSVTTVGPFSQEPAPGSPEAVAQAAEVLQGHTRGPWTTIAYPDRVDVISTAGNAVASLRTFGHTPETERGPNAALIAAAPDLLAERDSLRYAAESWKVEEEDWKRREAELLDQVTRLTIERNGARSLRDALKMQARLDASRLLDQETEVDRLRAEVKDWSSLAIDRQASMIGLEAEAERLRIVERHLLEDQGHLRAEVERLQGWLQKIDGGDAPCEDARQLRQWAYEAITLRRQP